MAATKLTKFEVTFWWGTDPRAARQVVASNYTQALVLAEVQLGPSGWPSEWPFRVTVEPMKE